MKLHLDTFGPYKKFKMKKLPKVKVSTTGKYIPSCYFLPKEESRKLRDIVDNM